MIAMIPAKDGVHEEVNNIHGWYVNKRKFFSDCVDFVSMICFVKDQPKPPLLAQVLPESIRRDRLRARHFLARLQCALGWSSLF